MKKFTKILSLALALALVLSTNVFAATVYYTQDFSGYDTVDGLLASMDDTWWNCGVDGSATQVVSKRISNGKNLLTTTTYGTRIKYFTGGKTTAPTVPTLTTDASGIKWFKGITATNAATGYPTNLVVAPNNTWDYTSETGKTETYVISYDFKIAPTAVPTAKTIYIPHQTLWTTAAGATGDTTATKDTDTMFKIGSHIYNENPTEYAVLQIGNGEYSDGALDDADRTPLHVGTNNDGSEKYEVVNKMYANRTYRFAATYKYDENYTWPYKETIVDGVVRGRANNALGNGNELTTETNPVLAAFSFGFFMYNGESIANIKMYTIDESDVFGVSRVGTELVPTDDASISIKFSMPVAPTADMSGVTIDGLTYGEDFTVTDIKDVVNGNEVYSTAKVKFTKALAGNTPYTITFPETVTNEIGKSISATANTVTFETEKAPTYILALEGYEGLAAGTTQIAADAMAGKTVYFKATATNDTGRATSGVLAIGIYEGENLVKYAFANKTFATDGAVNTFSAAFKLEAGQTAKAFVTGSNSVKVFGE